MKKNLFLAALALTALAGCTSDEFVGDQSLQNGNETGVIQFTSSTPNITRSRTGATAAADLGYQFAVYATKTVTENSTSKTSNVFARNPYDSPDNTAGHLPYYVWYEESSANKTTSNTYNWEYVGAAGSKTIPGGSFTLDNAQEIKYWDYSADNYVFTAYSKTGGTVTNLTTTGFTFSGTAAQLAHLYVADKLTITSKNLTPTTPATVATNSIGDVIQFTFRNATAKVRLGIYETIPGYEVKDVVFHYKDANNADQTSSDAYLNGQFVGASTGETTYNITYNNSSPYNAVITSDGNSNTKFFNFGTFDTDRDPATAILGTSSTAPTWASANLNYTNNYIPVFPNTIGTNIDPMLLKVDYTLHNETSGEDIKVTGATAAVPEAFMKWEANHAYTYLFKISNNTNGSTGQNVVGLYPITFDAVTIAAEDASEGTITTVSTPSITTYQDGSVTDDGITYKYNSSAPKPIYFTAQNNETGVLNTLTSLATYATPSAVGNVQVYKLDAAATEADLILTRPAEAKKFTTTIGADTWDINGQSVAAGKWASFTPNGTGTYAIEYATATSPAAFAYKIVVVE